MDLGVSNRVALVLGASKGMGFGIAKALAAEGARVALSSRSRDRLEAAAEEIGGKAFTHDAGNVEAAPNLVAAVEQELGPIEILVLNSGGPPAGPDPLGFSLEQWDAAYRMLVLGHIALLQTVVPGMRHRGWGRILSVSSTAAREPLPYLMLSNAHRPGLLGALKTLARHVAVDGVTVNSLLPGRIATDRLIDLAGGNREAVDEAAKEQVPAGRLGTVEEFAAAAAFLCSEPARYITGQTLAVDGGLTHAV